MATDPMEQVYIQAAKEAAEHAVRLMREPALPPAPVQLDSYPHLDHAFYERGTAALGQLGFRPLRDLDATLLMAPGSPPALIRVLLDGAGTTSAALYHVIPKSPGRIWKWLLRFQGKWVEPRIAELWTTFDDGILSTTNSGQLGSFSPPPWMTRNSLAVGTSVEEVLQAHMRDVQERRAATGREPRAFLDYEDLERSREENRLRTNAWRREIGGILPEELDRMVAPHGEHGQRIRPYLAREIAARVAVSR